MSSQYQTRHIGRLVFVTEVMVALDGETRSEAELELEGLLSSAEKLGFDALTDEEPTHELLLQEILIDGRGRQEG